MMPVGDVQVRDFFESIDQRIVSRNTPNRMMNIVVRNEIVERRVTSKSFVDQRIYFLLRPVGQKHRSGLRPQHQNMTRSIILLVAPGSLMFANDILIVFID